MAVRFNRTATTEPEVHRVTSAQERLSEEQRRRTKRYLISMGIRTACFIAIIFTRGIWQWVFLAGAAFLPYVAVVAANAGRENDPFRGELPGPVQQPELPAGGTRIIQAD